MKDREAKISSASSRKRILITTSLITFFSAISVYLKAQSTVETGSLDNIETDAEWTFSSTSESPSVEDAINNLEEYSIKESKIEDIEITEESRRRNTNRGIKDYAVEAEIYDY